MRILRMELYKKDLFKLLGLLATVFAIFGCAILSTPSAPQPVTRVPTRPPTRTQTVTNTPTPTQEPYLFTVRRESAEVLTGQSRPLESMNAGEERPFPEGYLLTTDETGEALLQGRLEAAACRVYVFLDTELRKRACPESTYNGGNASCVEAGSAVYQDCANHLAMTPSGEVEFQGTWVQVTYLPDQQVSIYIVAQGKAQVSPVRNADNRQLGRPISLAEGQFLYTAPDDKLTPIPGIPMRRALSVDQLPALLPVYKIQPWLERGFDKVPPNTNTFPSPELLTGSPDLVTSLEVTGPVAVVDAQLPIVVPVRVTVTNRGGQPADSFKVSIDATSDSGTFVRPFYTQEQPNSWYPSTRAPLLPGRQVVFEGQVAFSSNYAGQEVSLVAFADSCSGDEFMPQECRVLERDESNNASEPVKVQLDILR